MNPEPITPMPAKIYEYMWSNDFNTTEFRDPQVNPLLLTQNNFAAVTSLASDPRVWGEQIPCFVAPAVPDSESMDWELVESIGMVRRHKDLAENFTWQRPLAALAVFADYLDMWPRCYLRLTETEEHHHLQSDVTEPASDLDKETEDMCLKHDLLPYIGEIRSSIYETYHNVISVEPKRTEDPEIEDYEKVCFEIHLSGESAQILQDKRKFYTIFFKEVPKEKQEFFTFTHCILKHEPS